MKKKNIKQLPPAGDAWAKKELLLFEPKTLFLIIIISVVTLLVGLFGERGGKYLTSVLSPIPAHDPFDGTTFPIKQVPNWVKLTEAERKSSFNSLPPEKLIAVPSYNPARLALPSANLKWNDANDDAIRNEKITYSVPYLGSYKLDGLEGSGSHPAVDIKIPVGTPVYAIANGTVVKAQNTNGGFGNHVVIQHNNFPSLEDQNKTATIYSSYSHLNSFEVQVNQVVKKGQLIGFSGESGTATTPHLHFQIDNDVSSWHPYWPFTGAEQRAAGYSFFEAINNGLGLQNAVVNTINPMKYVQKYLGDQSVVASAVPETVTATIDEYEDAAFSIQITGGNPVDEGSEMKVIVQVFDVKGNLLSQPAFKDEVKLSTLNGNGVLNKEVLSAEDFRTGIANTARVNAAKAGKDKVIVRFRNKEFSSQEFEIIKKIQPSTEQQPAADSTIAVEHTVQQPETASETQTAAEQLAEVGTTSEVPPQIVVPLETTQTATATEVAPEAATPETPAAAAPQVPLPFTDVPADSKYFESLTALKAEGLVAGYSDGTFKTEKEVSRAEAITFILKGINQQVREKLGFYFPDVEKEAWYAKYVSTAFELGFVKGYPDGKFRPQNTVTLAEFFTMLFVAAKTDIDPQIQIALPDGVKADDWFAPYIQEAIKKNIIEVTDNKVDAGKPMTRGEIANVLYKIKKAVAEAENK